MEPNQKPTDAELDLLKVLWEHGPATVAQVQGLVKDSPPRGYTTILKLLQIMTQKGFVERQKKHRAHVYRAAVSSRQIHRQYMRHVLARVFDNSTGRLVLQALSARPVSSEELAEIRVMLDDLEARIK